MARIRAGLALGLIAMMIAWAGTAVAADCSGAHLAGERLSLQRAEATLDAAANALSANQGMTEDVPAPVRAEIQTFKNVLVATTDGRLACEASTAPDAQVVEARLAAEMGANRPPKMQGQDASAEGVIVRVREAWGTPEWLLVRIGFPLGACCAADDNLLLGYAHHDGGWRRIFRLQSDAYTAIDGAWGDFFDYLALPAEGEHPRRIVVAHGRPWPTSCWSGFAIDVFEPDHDRDSARRVFQVDHGYRRCRTKPQLTRTADGFELDAWLGAWGMPSVMREGLFRYRPQADTYVRVQPVAFAPQGFVGAWVDAKWPQASQWSRPAARAELEEVHTDLQNRTGFDWVEYGDVDRCPGNDYQVALNLERIRLDKVLSKRTVRFLVRADGDDVFTLRATSDKPNLACNRKIAMRQN